MCRGCLIQRSQREAACGSVKVGDVPPRARLFTDRSSFAALFQIQPKYMLLGGVIGAFITYTVIKAMASLGPAQAVMLIVVSQLIVAYVIELFGMFGVDKQPFAWRRNLGMAICIGGIILFKWE